MTAVLKDDIELFKQFSDNEGFRRWLTDRVFGLTYDRSESGGLKDVRARGGRGGVGPIYQFEMTGDSGKNAHQKKA